MRYKPNPLLYAASKDFYSSFKLAVTMSSDVDHEVLSRSVAKAMERYPYFCVYPEREENRIWLRHNPNPVPVFNGDHCPTLGSDEVFGHLLTFGCDGRQIFLNASHYIADGMGIDPLLKTVLYLYVTELYGNDGIATERISMPSDPIAKEEYDYPFPDLPIEIEACNSSKRIPDDAYKLSSGEFDNGGLYAYHIHISQRDMMKKAYTSDGSPVSFLSVMLYRALCRLDDKLELPVVAHVQHQYRAATCTPQTRHSMVSYIPVSLSARIRLRDVETQNTIVRGQILLGSETATDIEAVNRLLAALPNDDGATLTKKKESMRRFVENSIRNKTFGISYVGKMDWCGLDKHVTDIHAYIGEKNTTNMLLIEVMTVGDDFTLNFMQSGKGERYVKAFAEQLQDLGIPVRFVSETRYTLCDTQIP